MDAVFKALADPGRRALLDALAGEDGQTLTALCELLPDMSRLGVMKHLRILDDAHLVTTEPDGRSKRHYLDPVLIREIHDRWISRFVEPTVAAVLELRDRVEGA